MMGAEDVEKAILSGTPIQSQADLNEFITKASAEKKAAVGKELGIEDWNTLTVQEFANKASAYRESGKAEAYVRKTENIKKMREIESTKARNIPRAIALADGDVKHYADADSNIAIARTGDTFLVYDYNTGNVTRELTRAEVNAALGRYRQSKESASHFDRSALQPYSEEQKARWKNSDKIIIYENEQQLRDFVDSCLSGGDASKKMYFGEVSAALASKIETNTGLRVEHFNCSLKGYEIRKIIKDHGNQEKEALHGQRAVTKEDIVQIPRVIAENDSIRLSNKKYEGKPAIEFQKRRGNEKTTVIAVVSDKHLDLFVQTEYVNIKKGNLAAPKGDQAPFNTPEAHDGTVPINSIPDSAEKVNTSDEKITKKAFESELSEEKAAPTVKQIKEAAEARRQDAEIELLLGEKPTLRQKILSFFKQSARDYSADEKLSREARRLLRDYKTLFDRFSARNRGRNVESGNAKDRKGRRFAAEIETKISDAVDNVIKRNGKLGTPHNQISISSFPDDIAMMVSKASAGKIALENKKIAINGDDLWHEFDRHGDESIEVGRQQLPLNAETVKEALLAIYDPDLVEGIFTTTDNPKQRQSFAYAKKSDQGYHIVVEVVGGRRNPNVTPAMILRFSDKKWNDMVDSGKTLGEILYENDPELKSYLNVSENKSNRVTAAQFASIEAIAHTPRSPRFNNSIPDSTEKSNPSDENSSEKSSKNGKRYSMEDIDPAKMGEPKLPRTAGTMSTGQHKKRIADLTKAKSYTKDQIYDIVKKLPMADMAMEKTREQVAEAIWQIYNEQLTANERREAAHDIAQFLVARLLTEAKTENPDAAEANEAMAYLRTGIGRLAFSEADRAELLHNLDKDGLRRILGRWGFKGKRNADGTLQGVRTPMEVFVTDIAREMPGMDLHRYVTIHMP